jgi:hypothetical protein
VDVDVDVDVNVDVDVDVNVDRYRPSRRSSADRGHNS